MADSLPKQGGMPRVWSDQGILGGQPVLQGTRIPAEAIVAYLRDGCSEADIIVDYPSFPEGGVPAVEVWAAENLGPNWRVASTRPD